MGNFYRLSLASVLFIGVWESSSCYSILPRSLVKSVSVHHLSTSSLFAESSPEFAVVGEDGVLADEENTISPEGSGDYSVVNADDSPNTEDHNTTSQRPEYGALSPGTVVQVQVGDLALARKAWKKRRRTGSPLLVPCSVLNVDRQSMVRWNLIYLLEKFGRSRKDGVDISETDLSQKYRTFLKSSLQKQAVALGYDSSHELIIALFNKKTQESYGIRLVEKDDEQLSLKAPISRHKAQKRAAVASLLQFRLHRDGDHGDADSLTHTGYVRTRKEDADDRDYHFLPLSAALRVSQKDDVDTGRVEEKSIHHAVVFDYDIAGDGGSPLLTLSLNPRGVRGALKVKPDRKFMPIDNPRHMFNDLSVGDGPFRAKVVRLVPGMALIDFEVGRTVSSESMVKVLGGLSFKESVEIAEDVEAVDQSMNFDDDGTSDVIQAALDNWEDDDEDEDDEEGGLVEDLLSIRGDSPFEEGTFEEGEEEEDISNLFKVNDDGSLSYTDPETGETAVLDTDDEDFEDMMMVKSQLDSHSSLLKPTKDFQKFSREETKEEEEDAALTNPPVMSKSLPSNPKFVSKRLRVGDDVSVYIRSVSKQSCQFTVTTNPLVQGRNAKEIKKESVSQKKLKRLEKSLGGSLRRIWELEGQECNGTVKATSNTGDWVYVQPELHGLPVGVASLTEDFSDIAIGDSVRVRIAGVDEERGQLAMQVIDKVAP